MRATLRITWLLLSLGFLFDSIHSQNDTVAIALTTVTSSPPHSTSVTIPNGVNSDTTTGATPVAATTIVSTPKLEQTKPTTAASVFTTPPSRTTVANKEDLSASHSTIGGNYQQIPSATTGGHHSLTKKDSTTASASKVITDHTPQATTAALESVPTKAPMPSVTPPKHNGNYGINDNITTVASTLTPSIQQTTSNFISTVSPTSQGDIKTGISAGPTTTPKLTPSLTSKPSVIPGTVTPNQPKTGPTTGEPSHTKVEATSLPNISTPTTVTTTTMAQLNSFSYSLQSGQETQEEKELVKLCKHLMSNWQDGTCHLTWQQHNSKVQFVSVEINGTVKASLATQYYEEITKKPTDNKTLIAILASCGALLIMIVILAVCASHHRKPFNENQHLTEELHTVENGYHDNPTLEVMEVQPEMQEKKLALNGEFNDSWIVPIDNLMKDSPDEEDTHL
ncbi:podocalyxin isoform 2-T2 [Odontesthes bonariensis]|uniref:podocalyxin isoform X2 n=1 Tax=Odontesthes bonariensis TaxID=219752 RepID=UPI003F586963